MGPVQKNQSTSEGTGPDPPVREVSDFTSGNWSVYSRPHTSAPSASTSNETSIRQAFSLRCRPNQRNAKAMCPGLWLVAKLSQAS